MGVFGKQEHFFGFLAPSVSVFSIETERARWVRPTKDNDIQQEEDLMLTSRLTCLRVRPPCDYVFDSPPNSEFFPAICLEPQFWGFQEDCKKSTLQAFFHLSKQLLRQSLARCWPTGQLTKASAVNFCWMKIETGYKELTNQATSPTDLQFCSKAMWHLFALLSCVAWGAHWLDDQGWRFVAKVYLVVVVSLKAIWQCFPNKPLLPCTSWALNGNFCGSVNIPSKASAPIPGFEHEDVSDLIGIGSQVPWEMIIDGGSKGWLKEIFRMSEWGFLKWCVSPTTMVFPTKNDDFGVFLGVPPFKETPESLSSWQGHLGGGPCSGLATHWQQDFDIFLTWLAVFGSSQNFLRFFLKHCPGIDGLSFVEVP